MRKSNRLAIAVVAGATMFGGSAVPSFASSHREAPLIAGEPQLDNTDVYAFVSPDKADTVTMIANFSPIQDPTGGPNFYRFSDNARYQINIDSNGDAKPDITYRWTFKSSYQDATSFLYNTGPVNSLGDATLNFRQTYTLEKVVGGQATALVTDAKVAPSFVGDASMPNYQALRNQAIASFGTAGKSFAGQADDPFFLDLRVFDLLYGANLKEAGNNTLNNINVNTIAIQVPKSDLATAGDAGANPIVGIYSTVERPSVRTSAADGKEAFSGDYVQVSRLGNPLVNEVVIDVARKDKFNASKPENDAEYLERVTKPLVPKLIEKIYNIKAPAEPRNDLVSVFLTGVEGLTKPPNGAPSEVLRLNMSIAPTASPKRLGVLDGDKAGFPNGRRLTDDVVDIGLQALEGELVGSANDLGDGVDANDKPFLSAFPYVALPTSGSSLAPRGVSAAAAATTPADPGASTSATPAPQGGVDTGQGGTSGGMPVPLLPASIVLGGLGLAGWALLPRKRGIVPTL